MAMTGTEETAKMMTMLLDIVRIYAETVSSSSSSNFDEPLVAHLCASVLKLDRLIRETGRLPDQWSNVVNGCYQDGWDDARRQQPEVYED